VVVKLKLQLTVDERELIPPWTITETTLNPKKWGSEGVGAAPFFASLVGLPYACLSRFFAERADWIAEQTRLGKGHYIVDFDRERTLELQRDVQRQIQVVKAWAQGLVGDPRGAIAARSAEGGFAVLEVNLKERWCRLFGSESLDPGPQPLWFLAALALRANQATTIDDAYELMRRLSYPGGGDSTPRLDQLLSRVRSPLAETSKRPMTEMRDLIEKLDKHTVRLNLRRDQVAVIHHPLLPETRV
jgi:hypothetical protein